MSGEGLKYFFSYTSKDREFVLRLAKELRAVGAHLWLDQLDVLGGQHWDRSVEKALKSCKGMIAVLSPESVASDNVMDEVSYALNKDKLVVPILIGPVEIPLCLGRLHYADFTADYDAGFLQLLKALGIEPPAQPLESAANQETVAQDSVAPAEAEAAEPIVEEEDTAQETEEPSPPQVPEPTPDTRDQPKPRGLENQKAPSKSQRVRVLAAICVVALITVILIGIFAGAGRPKAGDVVTNSIGMKLVYIPAGSFMMGSGDSAARLAKEYGMEEGFFGPEFPQHEVHISKGFWMGQTEVTQGWYESVMNARPWSGNDGVKEDANYPAVYVTWDDAMEFCRKLSQQEIYRLPTEAEWEYACRAGTTTRFSFGDDDLLLDDYAWYRENILDEAQIYAHEVGQKKPNPWGLYDMHGNVWEWCSDFYDGKHYSNRPSVDPNGPSSGDVRSLRGGSWLNVEYYLRCSCRNDSDPDSRLVSVGFRVVHSQL